VVSLAFIYNLWVIIYRFAFDEIDRATNLVFWFTLDYLADLVYVLDIIFHFRTGYLDDGVLQTDLTKLRIHYMNSMTFYIDCLCLLPLDFLYLSVGFRSVFRCFRLVKIYRFWEFLDRTERHTNHPNVVRTMALLHYLFSIYHWNACIMHMIIDSVLKSSSMWPASPSNQGVFAQYLHALYWSTMALTRSVSDPPPVTSAECVFAVVQCVLGILLFAAILGHVANIVASVSAARKDFQGECCAIFIGCCS
jgi:cyclic nucleotide gated channel alpha 3